MQRLKISYSSLGFEASAGVGKHNTPAKASIPKTLLSVILVGCSNEEIPVSLHQLKEGQQK
jgi:hypothetical protein